MSYLNIYDNCSSAISEWEEILYAYDDIPEDDEVWEIARECEELPILGNIYQDLVLSRIVSHFCDETSIREEDLDIYLFINSIDTHLAINGKYIYSVQDYLDCIDFVKK